MSTYVETDPTPAGAAETAARPPAPAAPPSRWPRHLDRALTALLERRAVARAAGADRRAQPIALSSAPAITARASAPTGAVAGDVYYDTTNHTLYKHDGTAFRKVFAEDTDGPGSGLDADTLDGIQASGFRAIGDNLVLSDWEMRPVSSPYTAGLTFGDGTGWFLPLKRRSDGQIIARLKDDGTLYLGTASVQVATVSGAWTAYTPAWTAETTNPSLGNGSISGRYRLDGKTLFVYLKLTLGTTSTLGTGGWKFSLPTGSAAVLALGHAMAYKSGRYAGHALLNPGNTAFQCFSHGDTSNYWDATHPVAWASGNDLYVSLVAELA